VPAEEQIEEADQAPLDFPVANPEDRPLRFEPNPRREPDLDE
jgi:hypothetical protein